MGLKILQLFNRFPWPLRDGGALVNYHSLQGYYLAGCKVTAAVLNTSKHHISFNELPNHVKSLADFHLIDIDNRIHVKDAFLNLFTNKSYHIQRFESAEFDKMLIKLCKQQHFDIAVFESIFMAPYLNTIKKYSKAVCVLRAHNVEHIIWQTQAQIERNPIKKYYLKLLANRLKKYELNTINSFDALLAITENDKESFKQFGFSKPVQVMTAGIDINNFQHYQSSYHTSFFHLGSMDWMPNQEAVLWFINEVWPVITSKNSELTFTVAGRNMPESFFNLNQNGVKIIGEVENAYEFMSNQSIMIVPLFSGSGMRVKIIEGMAMAKCIISTSLGAQGIEVKNGYDILIANNKNEFIEHINNLINNPSIIKTIGLNARKTAFEKYDNKKIISETLNFYNSLLNKSIA